MHSPQPNEIYKHFKGNLYKIVTMAFHSETGEEMVVYQALYGDYSVYVRPLSLFLGPVDRVKYPDAQQEYRFMLVEQLVGQETVMPETGNTRQAEPDTLPEQAAGPDEVRNEAEKPPERQTKPEAGVKREAEQNAGLKMQQEELQIDPLVMEFLESDTYEAKLNILAALHARITDDMINTMAAALDVEINNAETEERFAQLKNCLLTFNKYEVSRSV